MSTNWNEVIRKYYLKYYFHCHIHSFYSFVWQQKYKCFKASMDFSSIVSIAFVHALLAYMIMIVLLSCYYNWHYFPFRIKICINLFTHSQLDVSHFLLSKKTRCNFSSYEPKYPNIDHQTNLALRISMIPNCNS